ncbi:rhodanese-like domain-containing protein [Bacteroidota bacterium]
MNIRVILSICLLTLSVILVFLPLNQNRKDQPTPFQQLELLSEKEQGVSVDLAARYMNENDSTIQFIDIRTPAEFLECNIPGSINIPYEELLNKEWQGYLNQTAKINILYANGVIKSNLALVLLNGKGYTNNDVLKGGMNEWFTTVMNEEEFIGERLTARENSIFENRRKARMLFTEINNAPDSLKNTFLKAKIIEESKLDGGCE